MLAQQTMGMMEGPQLAKDKNINYSALSLNQYRLDSR